MTTRSLLGLALASLAACAPGIRAVESATRGRLVPTAESAKSMMLLAPVETGVLVIDLGWVGAERALTEALASMAAEPGDVAGVLLTHAHRDHVGAWRVVRDVPFYLAASEVELFLGVRPPGGVLPALADWLLAPDLPQTDEVEVRSFSVDTVLTFGNDTVRAFTVPGHTAGSAAYLFRGVLFVGDAMAAPIGLFGGPAPAYSADLEQGHRSLERLRRSVAGLDVEWICTAHARCARAAEVWQER